MKYCLLIAIASAAYVQYDDCSSDATICQGDTCCGTATKDTTFVDCRTCDAAGTATPVANQAKTGVTRKICADRRQSKVIEEIATALTTAVDGKPAKYVAANYETG